MNSTGIGEEALVVLKDNLYQYNNAKERQCLNDLGVRLLKEQLLAPASTDDLIGWFERYCYDGESLDTIIASIKHPGMIRWSCH